MNTLQNARTTVVVREWSSDGLVEASRPQVMVVDSLSAARFAIRTQALEMSLDIARVVVDRAASALDCLRFVATLPAEFAGDVLFILDEDNAFLSAVGRGGDRLLYDLSSCDVAFYLTAYGLLREWPAQHEVAISA